MHVWLDTMFGPEKENLSPSDYGIIPRTLSSVMNRLKQKQDIRKYKLHLSFIQLYKVTLKIFQLS